MKVVDIGIRRKHLAALTVVPAPEIFEDAEYEENKILIDREILDRCKIEKGTEISAEDLKELIFVSSCYRAKQRAVWYLSKGDISEKALFDKLKRNFSEKASAFAVEQMIKRGYLNDRKYAENLVRILSEKNISKNAAVGKMLQKGLPFELIKDVLKNYKSGDENRAYNLLITKYKNKLNNDEGIKKSVAALVRRGFSYSEVLTALKKINPEE